MKLRVWDEPETASIVLRIMDPVNGASLSGARQPVLSCFSEQGRHMLIGMGGGLTGQEVAVLQLIVSLMYTIIYKYF